MFEYRKQYRGTCTPTIHNDVIMTSTRSKLMVGVERSMPGKGAVIFSFPQTNTLSQIRDAPRLSQLHVSMIVLTRLFYIHECVKVKV